MCTTTYAFFVYTLCVIIRSRVLRSFHLTIGLFLRPFSTLIGYNMRCATTKIHQRGRGVHLISLWFYFYLLRGTKKKKTRDQKKGYLPIHNKDQFRSDLRKGEPRNHRQHHAMSVGFWTELGKGSRVIQAFRLHKQHEILRSIE